MSTPESDAGGEHNAAPSTKSTEMPGKEQPFISMYPPWGGESCQQTIGRVTRGVKRSKNKSATKGKDIHETFITERTRLHKTWIIQQEKTKRLGMCLAVGMIVAAGLVVVFAPAGREAISLWVAGLFGVGAGLAGFSRIWGKTKWIEFGADQR